jgi:hypothetical protein
VPPNIARAELNHPNRSPLGYASQPDLTGAAPASYLLRVGRTLPRSSGQVSDNERWFLTEAAAMHWLSSHGTEVELASAGELERQ